MRVALLIFFVGLGSASAGSIYFNDDASSAAPVVDDGTDFPSRSHLEVERERKKKRLEEELFFEEKAIERQTVLKQNVSFIEINAGSTTMTVGTVVPYYYPLDKEQIAVIDSGTYIPDPGPFTIGSNKPVQTTDLPDREGLYWQGLVSSRYKYFSLGLEVGYDNHPLIALENVKYSIDGDAINFNTLRMKAINFPAHIIGQYFFIYDGRFQPYVKAGIGVNFARTHLTTTEGTETDVTYVKSIEKVGWGFATPTYSYGYGTHVAITKNISIHLGYNNQNTGLRSTKTDLYGYKVTTDADTGETSSSVTQYGQVRFEMDQSRTSKQLGIVMFF